MPLSLNSGAVSAAGPREANEDAVVSVNPGLHILADGTGGRAGGRVAAQLACETLASDLGTALADPKADVGAAIDAAVRHAHDLIRQKQADPALHGMATTLVVLAVSGHRLHVAHVGDSRVYLLRRNEITQLTRDHSLGNYLADNPGVVLKVQRPPETLMRALGLNADAPQVEHKVVDLRPGDIVMACSDGISGPLPDWLMAGTLSSANATSAEEVANDLVRTAIVQGTTDNASAIVMHVGDEENGRARALGWLSFLEGPRQGEVLALDRQVRIGTDASAQIKIDGGGLDLGAEIQSESGGFVLRDRGPKPGTFINDVAVKEQWLLDGDVVRVGGTRMMFKSLRLT